ncbi:DUF983 domain-containing protein [Mucilaginibacter sp.]|uniref:DUF983 domain-containing protein n=1 Tax=Mucilaginibacter sp. TaxID=1882438 RepID=UPI002ED5FF95
MPIIKDKQSTTPTAVKAALLGKCPKCRRGDMFATPPFRLFGQKMNERCPHCGFHFEVEPGFFYVAMFVSYAINVAIMVTFSMATYILTHSSNPWVYIAATLVPAFLFAPFTFRYSRVILLYWLTPGVHFESEHARDDYPNKNHTL